jgi:ABC-type polysaccharide/polyol phosphate transport system ATPase subunit
MLGDAIIKVRNLSKSYKLYNKASDRMREALSPFRKSYHREFHALKNINFDIFKGQTIGIIGKNGSGKSTLLKILTGVLTPSAGSVEIGGRVAALLELGAGFNPELTGLENIYLNGALMGYNASAMKERLQDIIDFADIGAFIDQPVRMYSSGMFVRLAFSVAINVDPDILIVDEALSVGDIRFQQKCIRKMQEFLENGKTVIFVGHDLAAIKSFCTVCFWINEGVLVSAGKPDDVIKEYSSFMAYGMTSQGKAAGTMAELQEEINWVETESYESFGDRQGVISRLRVITEDGLVPILFLGGERLIVQMEINVHALISQPILGFIVKDRLGNHIFGGNTIGHDIDVGPMDVGNHSYRLSFEFPFLSNGEYSMTIALADGTQYEHVQKHWVHDCYIFKVSNPNLRYQNGDGLVLEKKFHFEKDL